MKDKKLPHQLTTEDLLNQLDQVQEEVENAVDIHEEPIFYKNDVPHFLSKFKIETGDFHVPRRLLYKLYIQYSQERLPKEHFGKECGLFLSGNGHVYFLNKHPLEILKLINTVNPTKIKRYSFKPSPSLKRHYETFLEAYNGIKGHYWVKGTILHEVYRCYCIDNKIKKQLSHEHFISITKLYIPFKRYGGSKGVWFRIQPAVVKSLTPEQIERIKNERKMSQEEIEKRKQGYLRSKEQSKNKT